MKFVNKTIIVTGGSSGIGKSIAQKFILEGGRVIVFDIKKPEYDVSFFKVDIKNEQEVSKAFSEIENLDILINNAGVYLQSSIEKTTLSQLDEIVDVNFKGTYLMCKYSLPLLKKSRGNIINISSGLGVVPEPESPAYCSTKAAIIMLTKCMAQEYAKNQVRVNVVLPGPIDTPLLRNVFISNVAIKEYAELNPMKRIGIPEDVTNVVVFLASDEANYVTGGMYSVDGGESSSSLYSNN